ncbi:MAG: transporter ATP-binding protein [Deltaproteobacteria bacterium]|nr:transporter ATP-binding protein [Deltaproteobacteria bacterium]
MKTIYHLHSIRKEYGSTTVLNIEDLTILEGRLYTLFGANGAGKSTLLNILAFLLPPTAGEIYYDGRRVDWSRGSLEEKRKKVTLLHQSPYLFGGTVFANVAFGLKARGIPGEEQRRLVEKALDVVGLREFGARKARELSGGEAQRVAMARALVLSPEVFLLDEPLANIDRETAGLLEDVIASLPSLGTTVVMTTHDPDLPNRLNGASIFLEGGRVVGSGRTSA